MNKKSADFWWSFSFLKRSCWAFDLKLHIAVIFFKSNQIPQHCNSCTENVFFSTWPGPHNGRIWSNSIKTESVFPPCISSMCFFNSPQGNLQIFLKNKTLNRLKKSLNGEPSQTRASHDLFPLPYFDIPALMDSFRLNFFVSS